MSLVAIVRKDVHDSIRSGSFIAITLLFALVAGFWAAIQHIPQMYSDTTTPTSTLALLNRMAQPMAFFVPLLGLLISYGAISRERDSGSLKLALSLPNSRSDIVLGKFIGATSLFVLFQLGWDLVTAILQMITVGYVPPESGVPPWLIVAHALNPTAAVGYATRAIIPTFDEIMSYPVSASFYPPKWAGFAILTAWLVLSLGYGYRRFQAADIE
ncbi:ABC transporter permease [Haladaptatus sp. CMSO5]|uniref:ABC transporter permease n=1 Tax=Haladaptatus sp. CMSO5 TaxID=3120514 RepID=UPI002FCDF0E9